MPPAPARPPPRTASATRSSSPTGSSPKNSNPDLAQIGKFFELPPVDPGDTLLDLSHSELRDRANLLYFDQVQPGSAVYSVLARVTAAGAFRWPATQVTPMYDSRFSGLSASSVCVVSSD